MEEEAKKKLSAKQIIIHITAGLVLLAIGFGVANASRVNQEAVSRKLAKDTEYQQVVTQFNDTQAQLDAAQETLQELNDYKTKRTELSQTLVDDQKRLDEIQTQVDELNNSISSKQAELDTLTANVTKAAGEPKSLPAGDFTVGTDLPAGRYVARGTSNFWAHSAGGKLLVNTILREGEYVCSLDEGTSVHCGAKTTFTPIK